jgi:hypothetical protein
VNSIRRSGFGMDPEVVRALEFPSDVYIVDSTIRSLQSGVSGSRHTAKDLIDIGAALDGLGVRELIVNLSWKDGLTVCEGLAAGGLQSRIVGTFRARHPLAERWALEGLAAGADEICFESCLDGDHLRRLANPVLARDKRVSHAFAEGYDLPEILDLCRRGVALGVSSQSFHDSFFHFGLTPEAAKHFYQSVRNLVSGCPPLYVHLSNFYGNATMTAVAAMTGGASAADVCMNGIGHHCGHISLAEIVMVLEVLYGMRTGIRLDRLTDASLLVRERTGIPMPLPSPVVGDYAFLLDGAYWAAEAHLPYAERIHAKFPIPPDQVGNIERIIWSEGTVTPESIEAKLRAMGTPPEQLEHGLIADIMADLRIALEHLPEYPKWLSDAQFEQLCSRVVERWRHRVAASSDRSRQS